jgi:membrane protease YdiL (CAAX protease family)
MPQSLRYVTIRLRVLGALVICSMLVSCAIPVRTARLEPTTPLSEQQGQTALKQQAPTEIEAQAAQRLDTASCSPAWSWLMPGLGQLCMGKTGEGAALSALAVTEIGAAIALANADLPGTSDSGFSPQTLPLVGLQNLWFYSVADIYLEEDRAEQLPFTPQDTLGELVAAPFNLEVLESPDVWGGILATTAAAFAFSALMSSSTDTPTGEPISDQTPQYFGQEMPAGAAYPLAFATGTALFSHVAIGEEAVFRGIVQSSLARNQGEWAGWAWSSLIFGAIHIPNATVMPAGQRQDYLLYSVPFITAVGSYLGLSYKWSGYSLSHPVAVHFWYDFLLSAAQYAVSPGDSPIGMTYTLPF